MRACPSLYITPDLLDGRTNTVSRATTPVQVEGPCPSSTITLDLLDGTANIKQKEQKQNALQEEAQIQQLPCPRPKNRS